MAPTNFCCSVAKSCPTLCNPMDCSMPGFPVIHYLPRVFFMSIDSVILSNHLILGHPLLLLPSIFPNITLFQWVGSSDQVAKVLELLFNMSFQWIFRVDFFRLDWFDPLAVQEILKSLLQHHNLKPSIVQGSALFMVQLSHPYMTSGKNSDISAFKYAV